MLDHYAISNQLKKLQHRDTTRIMVKSIAIVKQRSEILPGKFQ